MIDIENDVAQAMIEGVNIQPSLLIVSPIGAEFQPQGLQIAPLLAAVSPIGGERERERGRRRRKKRGRTWRALFDRRRTLVAVVCALSLVH